MNTETLERKRRIVAVDIVAIDSDERIVLIGEIKISESKFSKLQLKAAFANLSTREPFIPIPFAIIVDSEKILIFKWDGANLSEPVCSLNTGEILRHYEPQFGNLRIFEPYLTRLVEAWLRDLAYNWKMETPPASEKMAEIGLLPLLKGGTTQSQVVFKS